MSAPVLTGARWSHAARCPRMAAYDVLGAFPTEPSERVTRLYLRGHHVEDAWLDHYAPNIYQGRLERQAAFEWGNGWETHSDAVAVEQADRPHIEVKSTTQIDKLPGIPVEVEGVHTTHAVLQAVGAAVFDPEGGTAEVVAVSPIDYWHERYPVNLTNDLRGAAVEVASRVVHAAETGELPDRVCQKPSDAQQHMCPYGHTCFADWDEPAPVDLTSPDLVNLAFALEDQTDAVKDAEKLVAEKKQLRDETRAELLDRGVPIGGEVQIADVIIKVTPVKGRESFDYRSAISAGQLTMTPELERYLKTGKPSERWTLTTEDPRGA